MRMQWMTVCAVLLSALLLETYFFPLQADVEVPSIFSEHMVLQQDAPLPVWGVAEPGEKVTVTVGADTASATAGSDRNWSVTLSPLAATSQPVTMIIAGKNTLTFGDVLKIDGNTVVVSSSQVAKPAAVRYDWQNAPKGSLYNNENLATAPFRTDDWTDLDQSPAPAAATVSPTSAPGSAAMSLPFMPAQQVVITDKNKVELQSFPLEATPLATNEVVIETECSFISAGTELSIYTGVDAGVFTPGSWCAYPWKAGYANVGIVREAGEQHRALLGKRVFTNGCHASIHRYATDDRYKLIAAVPDSLSSEEAVAARMAMVAMAGLDASTPQYIRWVVVIGLGMVGNLAAQLFRLTGAQVIGVDPSARRRALAQECGIAHVLGGNENEVAEGVRRITGGRLAQVAVDAVGHGAISLQALRLLADSGEVIVLGTPRVDVTGNLTEIFSAAHLRWITVKGALEWNIPTEAVMEFDYSQKKKIGAIFAWIADGRLRLQPLLSHTVPPEGIKSAYEGLLHRKDEYMGVVLRWR